MFLDQTVDLVRRGYVFTAWARRRRDSHEAAVRPRYAVSVRLLGRPATVVGGSDGVRLFYDRALMRRRGAMPTAVAGLLFGRGAVHGLDGEEHRHRKAMFVDALMDEDSVGELLGLADELLVDALGQWRREGGGVVYRTATEVYGLAVIRWAGIDVPSHRELRVARDLAKIVDGFATPGLPYVSAWRRRVACDRCAASLVREVRKGRRRPPAGSVLDRVSHHRDGGGELLDAHTAGVELQNVLRPTVAVARFAAFAALALGDQPDWRDRLVAEVRERGTAVGGPLATAFAQENDDPHEGPRPNTFEPQRFLGTGAEWSPPFVPHGGGRPESGHRCPGELVAVGPLALTTARLAVLGGRLVKGQDTGWSWGRVPALPRSGVVIAVDDDTPGH